MLWTFSLRSYRPGLALRRWSIFLAEWCCLYIFDDHDKEREFDAKGLLVIGGAGDVGGGDIAAHDLENRGLNILVGESFDVSIFD